GSLTSFHSPQNTTKKQMSTKPLTITATVPLEFSKLAKRYGIAPEYLASLVLCAFTKEHPRSLLIVSRQPDITKAQSAIGDEAMNFAIAEIVEWQGRSIRQISKALGLAPIS